MKFFCIHHSPAVDRKSYLSPFFEKTLIGVQWVEEFLPTDKIVADHQEVRSEYAASNSKLNLAEISCFMKHRLAIKQIADTNNDYGVIFEDDIEIPSFDLNKMINKFALEFSQIKGDILFIGSMKGKDITAENSDSVFYSPDFRSRCAHCYMLTSESAKKIYPFLDNIVAPFDWQLNMIINHLNLRCCWSTPHLNQRTEQGKIKSLLR